MNDAVYNIAYIYLQVVEYVLEDLLLRDAEVRIGIVRVRTDVNDAVYNIAYIYLQVVEYVLEDLLLCDAEVRIGIVRVRTDVNDAVHVKIQVVKLRNL